MCGLVTLITKRQWGFSMKDIEMFEELLTVDQLRGQDATGAYCVHKNQQVAGIKGAFTPWHLFNTKEWYDFGKKADATGRILVGHNRKATHGNKGDSNNAHPFQEDNIILVHNGTLYNHKKLADRDVDSHAVAAAFAKGNYSEVLSDINGAYVFIWYDMERKQLSIVRNKERPLFKFENDDMILFCSEAWMGSGILRRHSFTVHSGKEAPQFKHHFVASEVPTDKIFNYEVGGKLVSVEDVTKKAVVTTVRQTSVTTTTNMADTSRSGTKVTPTVPTNLSGAALARRVLAERVMAARKQENSQGGAVIPFPAVTGYFAAGKPVLVQINEVRADNANAPEAKQRFKVFGTTVEPGKPIVDIVGELPSYVSHDQIPIWSCQPVVAKAAVYRETVNGGPVLTCTDFRMDAMVQVWPTGFITETEWGHAVNECKCKHCEKSVGEWDSRFTSVKRNYKNSASAELEITCGDCIEEKIQDEEIRKEFSQGRLTALSEWESVMRSTGQGTGRALVVTGNSTAH